VLLAVLLDAGGQPLGCQGAGERELLAPLLELATLGAAPEPAKRGQLLVEGGQLLSDRLVLRFCRLPPLGCAAAGDRA
jgi:hypothetical protein